MPRGVSWSNSVLGQSPGGTEFKGGFQGSSPAGLGPHGFRIDESKGQPFDSCGNIRTSPVLASTSIFGGPLRDEPNLLLLPIFQDVSCSLRRLACSSAFGSRGEGFTLFNIVDFVKIEVS